MTTGLRRRAEQLFARGLEAADAGRLTRQAFRLDGDALQLRSPRSGSARDAGTSAVADETLPLDDFERRRAGSSRHDLEPFARQQGFDGGQQIRIVVHNQDAVGACPVRQIWLHEVGVSTDGISLKR